MSYVACRSIKVQKEDGTMEIRKAGDPVPEAVNFANPELWVRRGYIRPDTNAPVPEYERQKIKPMREAKAEDVERGQNLGQVPPAVVPSEVPKGPVIDEEPSDRMEELMVLSRSDLEDLAMEHGVSVEAAKGFKNRTLLAEAIIEAQG